MDQAQQVVRRVYGRQKAGKKEDRREKIQGRAAREGSKQPMITLDVDFDRDEVVICMLIASCLGNAVLSAIYSILT
jgi:hypothetical protein